MNGKEIWDIVRSLNPQETLAEEIAFLTEELGDIAKGILYSRILKGNPEARKGYDAELKKAFGDMIVQLKLLIYRCGFTWKECELLGEEALKERFKRLTEKGWRR